MTPTMYVVPGPWPGRFAIVPRPRGGDWLADDVADWRRAGLDIIVSLLTAEEGEELSLNGEADACAAVSIEFISSPIADNDVPGSRSATLAILRRLQNELAAG